MISIIFTSEEIVSFSAGQSIISRLGLKEERSGVYLNGEIELRKIGSSLLNAEALDSIGSDLIIFLSRHSSSSGVPSLTVHPTGNLGAEAQLGGKPYSLSVSAPSAMLSILELMSGSGLSVEKTYEATHHGPLMDTPSMFAEYGGGQEAISDKGMAERLGMMVYRAAERIAASDAEYSKVVIGIGSNHYPSKFTKLAVEKGYAFGHIMPKHALVDGSEAGLSMIDKAVERSSERPDCAVIDWKSLNSESRSRIIKRLDGIGIDHERI